MNRAIARARHDLVARIHRFDRRRHVIRAAKRLERRIMATGAWTRATPASIQGVINRVVGER